MSITAPWPGVQKGISNCWEKSMGENANNCSHSSWQLWTAQTLYPFWQLAAPKNVLWATSYLLNLADTPAPASGASSWSLLLSEALSQCMHLRANDSTLSFSLRNCTCHSLQFTHLPFFFFLRAFLAWKAARCIRHSKHVVPGGLNPQVHQETVHDKERLSTRHTALQLGWPGPKYSKY